MSSPFQQPSRSSNSFAARFAGTCDECGGGFDAGEEIRYAGTDLVHADPDDCSVNSLSDRPVKVCQKCFLVHAGDCF